MPEPRAVEARIAEVLREHRPVPHGAWYIRCAYPCRWQYGTDEDHDAHVAEVVAGALGLTQEWAACGDWRDGEVYSLIDGSRGSRQVAERHKYHDNIDVVSRWATKWVHVSTEDRP